MKLTIPAAGLKRALSAVKGAAAVRSSAAILSTILFEAGEGKLTLSATDGESAARLSAPVSIEEEGKAAIPARTLTELVGHLSEGEMEISASDGKASIQGAGASYTLRTREASDFPALPDFPKEKAFTVKAAQLSAVVKSVTPATSKDNTRPVLGCVLFSAEEEGKVRMAATDSFRLAIRDIAVASGAPSIEEGGAIVPARALSEAARMAGMASGDDAEVSVALTDNHAFFKGAGVVVSTTLTDGAFPDYKKLLPDSFARSHRVKTKALSEAISRTSLFAGRAGNNSPAVPITLTFKSVEGSLEGEVLEVSAHNRETGAGAETLSIESSEGGQDGEGEFSTSFNPDYLSDAIKHATGGEELVLSFNEAMKPAVVRGARDGDGGGLYLIMPMRDPYAQSEEKKAG